MRIIISPAKKMNVDNDTFLWDGLPRFLPQTKRILEILRGMTYEELQKLWKCNDAIALQNEERIRTMDLEKGLTPAIFAYEGIQYQYMAPNIFSNEELDYIREHLRILSGFYGILRPFDGVVPYRLEMQAKLKVDDAKDLYAFWGDALAKDLFDETDCIVDLASKEYSRCISKYRTSDIRLITCTFGEEKDGKVTEKGTMCKMARGEMVRWMAEHRVEDPEKLKAFESREFAYAEHLSSGDHFVYLRKS